MPGARAFATQHVLGPFPPAIAWFGAVGGSLVSLKGVMYYSKDTWDTKWDMWHALRPLVSGITGPMTALFILIAAEAVISKTTTNMLDMNAFYAISFIAGYRDEVLTKSLRRTITSLVGTG